MLFYCQYHLLHMNILLNFDLVFFYLSHQGEMKPPTMLKRVHDPSLWYRLNAFA